MDSAEHYTTPAAGRDMPGSLIADAARLVQTAYGRRLALAGLDLTPCDACIPNDVAVEPMALTAASDGVIARSRKELRGMLDRATQGVDTAATQRRRTRRAPVNSNLQTLASDDIR